MQIISTQHTQNTKQRCKKKFTRRKRRTQTTAKQLSKKQKLNKRGGFFFNLFRRTFNSRQQRTDNPQYNGYLILQDTQKKYYMRWVNSYYRYHCDSECEFDNISYMIVYKKNITRETFNELHYNIQNLNIHNNQKKTFLLKNCIFDTNNEQLLNKLHVDTFTINLPLSEQLNQQFVEYFKQRRDPFYNITIAQMINCIVDQDWETFLTQNLKSFFLSKGKLIRGIIINIYHYIMQKVLPLIESKSDYKIESESYYKFNDTYFLNKSTVCKIINELSEIFVTTYVPYKHQQQQLQYIFNNKNAYVWIEDEPFQIYVQKNLQTLD